jgi:hypothetical protein
MGEKRAGKEGREERSAGEMKEIRDTHNLEDEATDRYDELALRYGVHARLEDAKILYEAGRIEGALLMTLVAIAATSRKRYPNRKTMGDGEAFKTLVRDEIRRLRKEPGDTVNYKGGMPVEEFLYKYLRCSLLHEGELPSDIFSVRNEDVLTIDFGDGTGASFNHIFLMRLADVAWRARENSIPAMREELDKIAARISNHPLNRAVESEEK